MNSYKPIGGYFELELPKQTNDDFFANAILLNSGRNCLEYVLRSVSRVDKVYMPEYTCKVMFEPLDKLGIPYEIYEVNEKLEIVSDIELNKYDYLLYTNYFGLKDAYSRKLSERFGDKFILDCSQALYFKHLRKGHTLYSPRKFVGLPDGGCLYTSLELEDDLDYDVSFNRTSHLLRRIDEGAEAGYDDFKHNDDLLSNAPLLKMSKLTKALISTIDFGMVAQIRRKNFAYLYDKLANITPEFITLEKDSVPLFLPIISDDAADIRTRLIQYKVYTPTYWSELLNKKKGNSARVLAEKIVFLPIDQRYTIQDMQRIVEIIRHGN